MPSGVERPAGWGSTAPRILRTPGLSRLEVWMHNNSRRERSAIDQSTGLGAKCSSPAAAQQRGWQLPGAICWVAWVNHTTACPVQTPRGTQHLSDAAPRLSSSIFKLLADACRRVRLSLSMPGRRAFPLHYRPAVAHGQCRQVNICAGARSMCGKQ
jgi:hypothetical protein